MFDTGAMGRSAALGDHRQEVYDDLAARVAPASLARDRRLPVLPALGALFPDGGLRRGSAVSVDGAAATSLALALAAGASQDGAWVAAVGFPSLGLLAAAEMGLALERLVLVGGGAADDDPRTWPSVLAALVDAFEIVLVRAEHRVRGSDARRLAARAREQGAVVIRVGGERATEAVWPERSDVGIQVVSARWEGLGDGHGHLRARRVEVEVGGRREAARPRRATLWLPSADGEIEAVAPDPVRLDEPRRARSRPARERAG